MILLFNGKINYRSSIFPFGIKWKSEEIILFFLNYNKKTTPLELLLQNEKEKKPPS